MTHPQRFGKYLVTRSLGRGGMASVMEGRDERLDRRAAIKIIHPHLADETGFGDRFLQEARLMASLRHPSIVRLYEYDILDGQPYMVMEYLEGGTLKDRLTDLQRARQLMPLGEVASILSTLAAGLEYAHVRGLVHRDIKPANILFTAQGEAVITDFGIAKLLDQSLNISLTGSVIGTPVYMAPEQAAGQPVDSRSDQYSLAVMIYEMIAGRPPFLGESPTAIMMQHMTGNPPPPRQFNPNIPETAQTVLLNALNKNPQERYSSVVAFAQAFETALRGQTARRPVVSASPEDHTIVDGDETHDSGADAPLTDEATIQGEITGAGSSQRRTTAAGRTAPSATQAGRTVAARTRPGSAAEATLAERPSRARPAWLLPAMIASGVLVLALAGVGIFTALGGWQLFAGTPPVTPGEYVIAVADFDGAQASVRADFGRRIYDQLQSALSEQSGSVQVIQADTVIQNAEDAISAGQQLGAAMVIWGWYDDLGVSPRIEVVQQSKEASSAARSDVFTATPQGASPDAQIATQIDLSNFISFFRSPLQVNDLDLFVLNGPQQLAYITQAVLGLAFQSQGDLEAAVDLYGQALDLAEQSQAEGDSPGLDVVYLQRAVGLMELGQYDEAIPDLEQALALNPQLLPAQVNLAIALPQICTPARPLDQAIAAIDMALGMAPADVSVQRLAAGLYSQQGNLQRALELARQAQAVDGNDPDTLLLLGNLESAAGNDAQAADNYRQAIDLLEAGLDELDAASLLALGDALLQAGETAEAQARFTRVLEIDPGSAQALAGLGDAAMLVGDDQTAADYYAQWTEAAPEDVAAWNALGLASLRLQDESAARTALQQAINLDACNANAHIMLGGMDILAEDYAAAQAAYTQALTIEPNNAVVWYFLGSAAYFQDDFGGAVDAYSEALRLDPELLLARSSRASAYYRLEQYAEAISDALAATQAKPDDAYLHNLTGNIYEKLGNPEAAITAYQQSLALAENPDVRSYLGFIYAGRGEADLAAEQFDLALQSRPEDTLALSGLADALQATGDLAEAAEAYQALLALQPDPLTYNLLAFLYTRLGEIDKAIGAYLAVLELDPDDLTARSLLAGLYARLGDIENAEEMYQSILQIDAERPDAYSGLSSLAYQRCDLPGMTQNALEAARFGENLVFYAVLPVGAYAAAGQQELAGSLLDDLRTRFGDDPLSQLIFGEMAIGAGDAAQARTLISAALTSQELSPALASIAYADLGSLSLIGGDVQAASVELQSALNAFPRNAVASVLLGDAALIGGNPAQALTYYEQALADLPEYAAWISADGAVVLPSLIAARQSLASRADGQADSADQYRQQALSLVQALLERSPDWARAHFTAGSVYTMLGLSAEADAAYQAALACDQSMAAGLEINRAYFESLIP